MFLAILTVKIGNAQFQFKEPTKLAKPGINQLQLQEKENVKNPKLYKIQPSEFLLWATLCWEPNIPQKNIYLEMNSWCINQIQTREHPIFLMK